MNNPYNLKPEDRGVTPTLLFNKGINVEMSKARRRAKQARHRANAAKRLAESANTNKK